MPSHTVRLILAQVAALLFFALTHFALTFMANRVVAPAGDFPLWPFNLLAYALYVAAGYLAAVVAGLRPIASGALAGALCALVAVVVMRVSRETFGLVALALSGLLLGGVGGLCYFGVSRKNASRQGSAKVA